MSAIDDVLTRVSLRIADHEADIAAQTRAPFYRPFEFVDTSELGLSRILAWMLSPDGTHAQGDRFLRLFMDWLG